MAEAMLELSAPFKNGVVWTIVAELFWRHHASQGLWLQILRPGGGQYFCVSLLRGAGGAQRALFNLNGTSLSISPEPRSPPDWFADGYQAAVVSKPGLYRVVDDIESMMGLPGYRPPHPRATRPVLCVRLIAELARDLAFGNAPLIADSGYLDSSGMEGAEPQLWLRYVAPDAFAEAQQAQRSGDSKTAMRIGARYWRLRLQGGARDVVLELGTAIARVVEHEHVVEVVDLMAEYDRLGRSLRLVASWILSRLTAA